MTAEITTSCRSENTKYTRLNQLAWGILCPHAMQFLWHGSAPLDQFEYPTAEESKKRHRAVLSAVKEVAEDLDYAVLDCEEEYEHRIGFRRGEETLCALSKADAVCTLALKGRLLTLYLEVSSSRINVAKPWQALLRGLALYYERRLPVLVVVVSPRELIYKLVSSVDQERILRRVFGLEGGAALSPNLCSLCELVHVCPYRLV